jgi:hypothetical protein
MLCKVCQAVFNDPATKLPDDYGVDKGPPNSSADLGQPTPTFKHHATKYDLQMAAEYCYLCSAVWKFLYIFGGCMVMTVVTVMRNGRAQMRERQHPVTIHN